jgi:hypothetical protein
MKKELTGGYEGPDGPVENTKLKPPEDCLWELPIIHVGSQEGDDDTVYVTLLLDGEPLGSIRLPSSDYVRHLRQKIYSDLKEPHNGIT